MVVVFWKHYSIWQLPQQHGATNHFYLWIWTSNHFHTTLHQSAIYFNVIPWDKLWISVIHRLIRIRFFTCRRQLSSSRYSHIPRCKSLCLARNFVVFGRLLSLVEPSVDHIIRSETPTPLFTARTCRLTSVSVSVTHKLNWPAWWSTGRG